VHTCLPAAVRRPTTAGCTYALSCLPAYACGPGSVPELTLPCPVRSVLRVVRRERRPRSVPGQPFRKYQPTQRRQSLCLPSPYWRAYSRNEESAFERALAPD
jgi:hypothetical protein